MDLIAQAVTLKSIKLNDSSATKLLFSAKHSVLYSFDCKTSNWEKAETEGCLAIYKRIGGQCPVLFILNRLQPENFSCPLEGIQSAQLEGDLLMLLLKNNQVTGIWLFDERERLVALEVLQKLLAGSDNDNDIGNGNGNYDDDDNGAQLKKISVTDLFGENATNFNSSSSSIMDLLAKAKVKQPQHQSSIVSDSPSGLESAILENFSNVPASTSLKSFTASVAQFLQANPHLLAGLHRKCIEKESPGSNNK